MATWQQMALDCLLAAQDLLGKGRHRSAIARAYYAAYCAVASTQNPRRTYRLQRQNPSHEELADLINSYGKLPKAERIEIRKSLTVLQIWRVDADYRPVASVEKQESHTAVIHARSVLVRLGII